MARKRIIICLRYVAASLLKHVGISGLIGAGIGLAYTPFSIGAINMVYSLEGEENTLVDIISLPAVPFYFFASGFDEIGISVMDMPGALIPVVLFTAIGTGIGASVHWTRNLVKKTRSHCRH